MLLRQLPTGTRTVRNCDAADNCAMRSGISLASDRLLDAAPIVDFRPSRTASYTVRVSMVGCSIEPCYYGLLGYRGQ